GEILCRSDTGFREEGSSEQGCAPESGVLDQVASRVHVHSVHRFSLSYDIEGTFDVADCSSVAIVSRCGPRRQILPECPAPASTAFTIFWVVVQSLPPCTTPRL